MGADKSVGIADRIMAVARRSPTASDNQDRKFWVGLACALIVHAALIFGAARYSSRQMGEPDGKEEGVTVDVVDAADLVSRETAPRPDASTPSEPAATQPAQPATPAAPPLKGTPQPHHDAPTSTDMDTVFAAPQPDATPRQTERPTQRQPERQTSTSPHVPEKAEKQEKPEKQEKQEKQKPREPNLPLNLNMPDVSIASLDRSAAVTRPEGVTRSGANDEFGRGVIRALRQTMPNPRGMNGRVTIRLLLSETGNLLEVRIIRSGGDPVLDQSVVFAVKQTSFPIPPVGSVLADRSFLVTYIYR